ncbi:MAG: lytic transglycosylase domain-containing protein [Crocinitomicaceae bacterium]|nr:lytic transglycosylase domain-containing protein [Crocinitomicaceae bacterium]
MKRFVYLTILSSSLLTNAQNEIKMTWENEIKEVEYQNKKQFVISPNALYKDNWHNLPQTQFWKQIVQLPPDSCLINVAANRRVLHKMAMRDWNKFSETQKVAFKDSIRSAYQIEPTFKINVTEGKNHFYKISEVSPSISNGILEFKKNKVDPWYAQAILLIESPAVLQKSVAGAYGPFQLMPTVARKFGLTVNTSIDERESFERSAYAASKLIQTVCIPEAKNILNEYGLKYSETDVWFRLIVMHIYHAGSGNVRSVFNKIQPTEGGQELIQKIWTTSAGSFGNASQNYSQVALATQIVLDEIIQPDVRNKINPFTEN